MIDHDLLVLVASPALIADEALWARCEDRARDAAEDTPVSLLVHTVEYVNQQLAWGNSFFRDVIAEGIVLQDAGRVAIAEVTPLTPAQYHALAEAAFPRYFERAAQRYASFEHSLAHAWHAIAAFELHQIAEMISKVVLLVFAPPTCSRRTTSPNSAGCAPGHARSSPRSFRTMRWTARASRPSSAPRTSMRAIASRSTSRVRISRRLPASSARWCPGRKP